MNTFKKYCAVLFFSCFVAVPAFAGTEGSISGTVTDPQGIALSGAPVQLLSVDGRVLNKVSSSATGEFQFFPVQFGDYQVSIQATGLAPYTSTVHVTSGGNTEVAAQLSPPVTGKEMVLEVKAKRHLVQSSAATSASEISQDQIATLPQGNSISLPKLLTSTTPGVVSGSFGQMFFRGNHANIQYQIDGVQLPDSPSNTFGDSFSPRNIDHMEVITGGIPAEYGERLAAVINIITKSGAEKPGGELELNYGSYDYTSPHLLFGGSNESGSLHYFISANAFRTDRGLDTPQPVTESNQLQGGTDAIHDVAYGNNEFAKVDWLADNENKISFILFNADNNYQIPNYPASFQATDPFFSQTTDQFGNGGTTAPVFNFVPYNTNDTQAEVNAYAQVVWKHTFSKSSFLQLAPYYKYSQIVVTNDPAHDLAEESSTSPNFGGSQGPTPIASSVPSSFAESRHTNNLGLKADYSYRPNDSHLLKAGFQAQYSRSDGGISIQTDIATAPVTDNSPDIGTFESLYAQDDWTLAKPLILNIGLRYDATQFAFSNANPSDFLLQPRIGLNYLAAEKTKLHAFVGTLFQPAPVENLRDTFIASGASTCPAGQLCPYDIKAEKDIYTEVGVAQQVGDSQAAFLNIYYKNATNMLDDAQLLNSSVAQPFNYATGFATGIELSVKGNITEEISDFSNYSYEIAQGSGLSGGIFATANPGPGYQFLDHVQIHTANAGLSYKKDNYWVSTSALYGSGLRTGVNNVSALPGHYTQDLTVGYEFKGDSWWQKAKVSGDILNLFNNVYPITVANGYNGSHYAAGFEFYLRLTKTL